MARDNNHGGPSSKCHDVGVAVGVIISHDKKILLMQRQGSTGEGTWAIPGGAVDFGETPEAGAIRETMEETGLKIHSLEFLGYTNDVHDEVPLHFVTLRFFTTSFEGTPKIMEENKCSAMGWFSIDELPKPMFPPTLGILSQENIRKLISNS